MRLEKLRSILRNHDPVCVNDPSRREAAVALVLLPTGDSDTHILLIKRATRHGDPWSGQMALPGGRRDRTDEDLVGTAIRETVEETGIDLAAAELLGQLDDLAPVTPTLPPILVRPFVFALDSAPPIKANAEVDGYVWASLTQLQDSELEAIVEVRGAARAVPAYQTGDEVVWGMTFRIIKGFLSLRE